ncbi:helix-turn-helix domain-containing protein [Mycobacterium riyadhense]|nr:helix-turn-helix domain-containing protein [Mycobacterium riyadhense]
MSWSALTWATDADVGPTTTKFILILLANKADENFSCYPSIGTLMAEANASRSTVLRALKNLEQHGFITRRPQFHDSGAQRSSRYFLNHPLAPHISPDPDPASPDPDLKPRGFDLRQAPSHRDTGRASRRHPTGVSGRHPLNPSPESPSEPSDDAVRILKALAQAWKVRVESAHCLSTGIESALARGWPAADLITHLSRNQHGVRNPVGVMTQRLGNLPQLPDPDMTTVPWCGECEDAHSRTITVTKPDGSEAARFCPQCSPQVHRDAPPQTNPYKIVERW